MTVSEIRKAFPMWSDTTVAEAWLRDLNREIGAEAVSDEFGVYADENGEYTLTAEEVAKILASA